MTHFGNLARILILATFMTPALAGVVPGKWEKVESLPGSSSIRVSMRDGRIISGDFLGLGPGTLTIRPAGESQRELDRSQVVRIESSDLRRDPVSDGTLLGVGIGFGSGVVAAFSQDEIDRGLVTMTVGGVGAGVGALVGFLVDSSIRKPEVFYRAR